jgi:hypothetical protein
MDKTLLLTCGPDWIAYSMFHIFNFGQLIVASDAVFGGQLDAVRKLNVPVHVTSDNASDELLARWMQQSSMEQVKEYLGASYSRV